MYCRNCGRQVQEGTRYCPYCGSEMPCDKSIDDRQRAAWENRGYAPSRPANGYAIAGFVLAFFFALLGLIFSIIGYNKSKVMYGSGRGLAIAGIIISAVWMGFVLICIISVSFM